MSSNLKFDATDRVMNENRIFSPSQEVVENANITAYMQTKGLSTYDELYKWSLENREEFWSDLAKELQYLQNYIDLQKIRFGNKAFVDFKITGEVSNQKIVPLLLIAFIENAFKHGVASDPSVPIRLMINLSGSNLHFYIENKKHMNNRDIEGGVGLANVERRLELLYPGNYKLDIQDKPDIYTAELSLVL